MTGEDESNGKIKFGLDNWDLSDLENSRLSFVFSPADRGRFDRVAFYYKAPKPANDKAPDSSFGSTQGTSPPSNFQGFTPFKPSQPSQPSPGLAFLPPPGPEALPGDVSFEGPVMPIGRIQTAPVKRPLSSTTWPQSTLPQKPFQSAPVSNPVNQQKLTDQEIAQRRDLIQRQRQIQADEMALAEREAKFKRQKDEYEYQRYTERINQSQPINSHLTGHTGFDSKTNYDPSSPVLELPDRLAMNERINSNQNAPQRRLGNTITPQVTGGVRNMAAMLPPPSGSTATGNENTKSK